MLTSAQERRLLYIFWGVDDFTGKKPFRNQRESGDQSLLSTNTSVLDGQKLTRNDLRASAGAMPFLAPRRLVIVRACLSVSSLVITNQPAEEILRVYDQAG